MMYRYDKDELLSCIISLQTMCDNLARLDQEQGNTEAQIYHDYMAVALGHIYEILNHRLI